MDNSVDKLTAILTRPEEQEGLYASALERMGLKDPEKASALWKKIIPTGVPLPGSEKHAASLIAELMTCPDPDMALLNLSRYVDAVITPSHFLSSLFLEGPLCHLLVTIFSCSYYLSDILVRNTGYLSWLIERSTLEVPKSHSTYLRELKSQVAPFEDSRRRINSVKRYKRREMLRIGARDLLGIAGIEETTAELSFLADAVVEITADTAFEEETNAGGIGVSAWNKEEEEPFQSFSVLSLGKLGGTELNYSSDIDLLYICRITEGKREGAFYTSLAKRITGMLTETTEEGTLYRVDLRLRPDGESGPLVVTVDEHLNYMMRRARPWEKQALLKSRLTAGNVRTAEAFAENCEKIIYSPIGGLEPLDDILTMRERAIAHMPAAESESNIKLMSGGIRDIEFMAQALQLIHGMEHRGVRSRNTLETLERLHTYGLLSEEVKESLGRYYRLFRTVEHRLQLFKNVRTHTIPKGEEELRRLGARVSYSSLGMDLPESFRAELGRSIRRVQRLFDTFFKDRRPGEIPLLLSLPPGEKEVERILSGYGIGEGETVHRFLSSLVYGDFPNLERPETLNAAARWLPPILEKVAGTPDPALTIKNLVKIVKASGAVRQTLELLAAGGGFLSLLLTISSLSTRLTDIISGRIELIDALAEGVPPGEPPDDGGDTDRRLKNLQNWYEEAMLYIHCRNPLPENGPEALGPPISEAIEKVLTALFKASGGGGTGLALFALGSLGSRECRLGSDLDLVAVIPDDDRTGDETGILRRLAELGGGMNIGSIDFRLRGEGEGSPLVQTLNRYKGYFETRAAFWELLAFTKCRFICGDAETGKAFNGIVRESLAQAGRGEGLKENLLAARSGLKTLSGGIWDVKHAPGGLYDISFIVSSARLAFPSMQATSMSTIERIGLLQAEGLIDHGEAGLLVEAFRLYYIVEHAAALHNLAYPPLAERETFFESYLNRLLAASAPGEGPFPGRLETIKNRIREIFLRFIERLGS